MHGDTYKFHVAQEYNIYDVLIISTIITRTAFSAYVTTLATLRCYSIICVFQKMLK